MRSFAVSDSVGLYIRGIGRVAAVVMVMSVGGLIADYVTIAL